MSDLDRNPYAPPVDALVDRGEMMPFTGDGEISDYEIERRPVVLCIVFSFITLGLYPSIWLLQRRPFLDSLQRKQDLGVALPIITLAMNVLAFALAFAGKDAAAIRPIFSLVAIITGLLANFRVLNTLRTDSARTGRFLEFSTIRTFFFGIYYLQYKINQLADLPARVEKPRRKKKRKKPIEAEAPLADEPPA